MRSALRILCGLNAAFQILVGLLCTIAPAAADKVFELAQTGPSIFALTRMFGGLLFGSGMLSGLVARDPDRNRDLPILLAAACVVNVSADMLVVGNGEMPFGNLAVGVILQVVLVALALAYVSKRRAV
jgi:drug/metabolite transporter (DMT)-like permease